MTEDEMGEGHVAGMVEMRSAKVCSENLKGGDHFEEQGISRQIILKRKSGVCNLLAEDRESGRLL
jgi:hypothetical protein